MTCLVFKSGRLLELDQSEWVEQVYILETEPAGNLRKLPGSHLWYKSQLCPVYELEPGLQILVNHKTIETILEVNHDESH